MFSSSMHDVPLEVSTVSTLQCQLCMKQDHLLVGLEHALCRSFSVTPTQIMAQKDTEGSRVLPRCKQLF